MLDAVLLEWEGVLADTGPARRDAMLRALADEGVRWTAAAYDACGGGDVPAVAAAALASAGRIDATLADLVVLRASRAFAERLAHGFTLRPGAAEFIAGVEHRAPVAIVTRAARAEMEIALRLSGLAGSIVAVVTADDVPDPPPAPMLYERALRHLARRRPVRASRVVAMLDTVVAARAARGAGLRTLAVGAPAHVAVEADAAVDGVRGLTLDAIASLVGVVPTARQA
jgi:beta-phosphoglucomutase-like phosphatase (HAD superfamily)